MHLPHRHQRQLGLIQQTDIGTIELRNSVKHESAVTRQVRHHMDVVTVRQRIKTAWQTVVGKLVGSAAIVSDDLESC